MVVTGIWIALLIVAVLVEILGRLRPSRVATFNRATAIIESRVSGRVLLLLAWIFVGVHLFVRYTVPH
jgi:hypothetical protein